MDGDAISVKGGIMADSYIISDNIREMEAKLQGVTKAADDRHVLHNFTFYDSVNDAYDIAIANPGLEFGKGFKLSFADKNFEYDTPSISLDIDYLATKEYVDGNYLSLSGGEMKGKLIVSDIEVADDKTFTLKSNYTDADQFIFVCGDETHVPGEVTLQVVDGYTNEGFSLARTNYEIEGKNYNAGIINLTKNLGIEPNSRIAFFTRLGWILSDTTPPGDSLVKKEYATGKPKPFIVNGGAAFNGEISNYVATGTAPFKISSTTLVDNLNADMLDGKHAADFVSKEDFDALKKEIEELKSQLVIYESEE